MRRLLVAVLVVCSLSCSVVLQDGVRSSGAACSTSYAYSVGDVILAVAWEFVLSRGTDPNPELDHIPTGVFGLSSLVGLYKHHNCVRYRDYVEEHRVAVCSGGARAFGKQCFCADGMNWNGLTCQGTPIAGACSGGGYPFGPQKQCMCLDGYGLNNGQCIELNCTGGSVPRVNQCVCPDGTDWDAGANQCVAPQVVQQSAPEGGDAGDQGGDQTVQDQPTCPAGAVLQGDQCACPDGTEWDGAQCSAIPQPAPGRHPAHHPHRAPPPPVVHTQVARPRPVAAPVKYHASYRPQPGAAMVCQVFDESNVIDTGNSGRDPVQLRMTACSQWCTQYLAQKLACKCSAGGC
jgi:hypothetical protein